MKSLVLVITLAARNLIRQGRRTVSTLMAISIGLVGLAFLDGYISYSLWGLKETIVHSGTGHLQVAASDRYFDEGDTDPYPYLLTDAKALAKKIRRDPAVKAVIPSLNFAAVGQFGTQTQTLRVSALPTSLRLENLNFLTLRTGTELKPGVGGCVLLGVGLARHLQIGVGNDLTLFAVASDGTVVNQTYRVAGLVSSGMAELDRVLAVADLKDAQALLGTDEVAQLTVFLEHTEDTTVLAQKWAVRPPWSMAQHLVVKTWDQLSPYYQQASGSYLMVLAVAGLIVLLVALFSIGATLNLSVLERGRELGTLRALGTRRSLVVRLLLAEGLLLGLTGALLGSALGWILTEGLNAGGGVTLGPQPGMTDPLTIFFKGDPAHTLKNAMWVTIASLIGALLPGIWASRRQPVDLLRSE